MARALSLFGFTGGFLMISPQLRQTLLQSAWTSAGFVQNYSPYSYIGIALVVLGGVALMLASGSAAR